MLLQFPYTRIKTTYNRSFYLINSMHLNDALLFNKKIGLYFLLFVLNIIVVARRNSHKKQPDTIILY